MEASSDNGGPATDEGRMASTKLRASELYLDKIAEIRATRTGLWPCSGGITEDEEEEGEEEEDEDGVGTTKARLARVLKITIFQVNFKRNF